MRYSPQEYSQLQAAQKRINQALQDYERFRGAYLHLLQTDPEHEVALAMIGADVDRAHARLQAMAGLQPSPFALEPSAVLRRRAAADNDSELRTAANA